MNFARFCRLNASKFPNREFLIESYPSKKVRRALTWKQLNEQTNKVANFLTKECGIKKGDVVQHRHAVIAAGEVGNCEKF